MDPITHATDTLPTRDEIVAAVRGLQEERDRLLGLLAEVAEGHVRTSRDDVALVQLPAGVFEQIRAAVDAAVAPCPDCGSAVYAGTSCGLCELDALPEGDPAI
jgi:hypothetical protein